MAAAAEVASEFYEQDQQNKEIDKALTKCRDGLMLDACQIGGQIIYWNGNLYINHKTTDTYMAESLMSEFEKTLLEQAEAHKLRNLWVFSLIVITSFVS